MSADLFAFQTTGLGLDKKRHTRKSRTTKPPPQPDSQLKYASALPDLMPQFVPPVPTPSLPQRMFNDPSFDTSKSRVGQGLPKLIIPGAAVSPEGFIAYSTVDKNIYYSDGIQWLPITGSATFFDLTVLHNLTVHNRTTTLTLIVTAMRVVSGVTAVLQTDSLLLCNTSGGAVTLNLPAGTQGQTFYASDIGRVYGSSGSSTNNITLSPNGTDVFILNNGSIITGNYTFGLDGAQCGIIYVPASVTGLGVGAWRITPATGVAPYNLTVYVNTGGSDSNNGLAVGTPVQTLQQALNIVSAIGWENTCTISLGSGTFNVPTFNVQKVVYGRKSFPVCIQGTLSLVYSGTINTITNTYVGANIPDVTNNLTLNCTVGASSGSNTLRGDYLRVTSGLGTANQIGYFIVDNTQNSPTTESYQMCMFSSGPDAVISGSAMPLPVANDTYSIFTRATTLNFSDSNHPIINGNGDTIWFKDLNQTQVSNTNHSVEFCNGTYLFTDVQLTNSTLSLNYTFEPGSRMLTGREIVASNPTSGSIDVAGIYTTSGIPPSALAVNWNSTQNAVYGSVFRVTLANSSNGPGTLRMNCCVFVDSQLHIATSTLLSSYLLFNVTIASAFNSDMTFVGGYGTITTSYFIGSAPGSHIGINCTGGSTMNASTINVNGIGVAPYSKGIMVSQGAIANIATFNTYNNVIGLNAILSSIISLNGVCSLSNGGQGAMIATGSSLSVTGTTTVQLNTGVGINVLAGSSATFSGASLTVNQNQTGISITTASRVSLSASSQTCSSNTTNGIFASGGSQLSILALTCNGNGAQGIQAFGISLSLSGTCSFSNTANGFDGMNLTACQIQSTSVLSCNNNTDNGILLENCVAYISGPVDLSLNSTSGIRCLNGTRLDVPGQLTSSLGNNGSYGLECRGSSVFVQTTNTVSGNLGFGDVKVGSNAVCTWVNINTNTVQFTWDVPTAFGAGATPTFATVRNRLA